MVFGPWLEEERCKVGPWVGIKSVIVNCDSTSDPHSVKVQLWLHCMNGPTETSPSRTPQMESAITRLNHFAVVKRKEENNLAYRW